MYKDEIRVLEKAITNFNLLLVTERADIEPKLVEFKIRLEKSRQIATKV